MRIYNILPLVLSLVIVSFFVCSCGNNSDEYTDTTNVSSDVEAESNVSDSTLDSLFDSQDGGSEITNSISDGELSAKVGEDIQGNLSIISEDAFSVVPSSSDITVADVHITRLEFSGSGYEIGYVIVPKSSGVCEIRFRSSGGANLSSPIEILVDGANTESADTPEASVVVSQEQYTYILNTSSHRFHYPECRGVKDMKEENKGTFTGTRDQIVSQGYKSCGICKP